MKPIRSCLFRACFPALLAALVLAACESSPGGSGGNPSSAQSAPSDSGDEAKTASEYRLGSGDKLKIVVFGHEDVSGEFVVDGGGNIATPLIGRFPAGGKTVTELQDSLTTTLNENYIVNPKISIEVLNYRPFFILGEVQKPGSYPYVAGIDVLQAVALGGGFTRRARTSSVTIQRDGKDGRYSFTAQPEARVLPGDTVRVDRRLF